MDKRNTKYLQLAETLRREIAKQAPGSAFMTVRRIMEEFKASQATTTKALEILDNEGLVERSLGSGIYVTEKAALLKSCSATVCLALPNWPSNRLQSYELEFHELAEELGFLPETLRFKWSDAVPNKLPPIKIDALLVYSAAQESLLLPKLPLLNSFGIPVAFLNRNTEDLELPCAYCDDRDEGAVAADHLVKTGHRKLAVLVCEPRTKGIDEKVDGFVKYARLQGVETEILDPGMKNGELAHEAAYRTMRKALANGKPDFSAVFAVSNDPVVGVYKAIYEAGLRIPGDLCVVAASDSVQSRYLHPSLTCVSESPEKVLRAAVETLLRIAAGGEAEPKALSIAPELIARESTRRGG